MKVVKVISLPVAGKGKMSFTIVKYDKNEKREGT